MLHKGPTGILRLAKNAIRLVCGPMGAPGTCGLVALRRDEVGFVDVDVTVLEREGGIARARRSPPS